MLVVNAIIFFRDVIEVVRSRERSCCKSKKLLVVAIEGVGERDSTLYRR